MWSHLHALQLVMDRAAEQSLELAVEHPARHPHLHCHLGRGHIGASPRLDDAQRLANVGILDRKHITAPPDGNARRGHVDHGGWRAAESHSLVEHAGRLLTDPAPVVRDARESGGRQTAQHLVVTDPHDSHIVRNRDPATTAPFDDAESADIAGGDHAHGFRQGCQPACDRVPIILVVTLSAPVVPLWRFMDVKAAAQRHRLVHHRIAQPLHGSGRARKVHEVANTAFGEVRNTEAYRRLVVGVDSRKGHCRQTTANMHDRSLPRPPGARQ